MVVFWYKSNNDLTKLIFKIIIIKNYNTLFSKSGSVDLGVKLNIKYLYFSPFNPFCFGDFIRLKSPNAIKSIIIQLISIQII